MPVNEREYREGCAAVDVLRHLDLITATYATELKASLEAERTGVDPEVPPPATSVNNQRSEPSGGIIVVLVEGGVERAHIAMPSAPVGGDAVTIYDEDAPGGKRTFIVTPAAEREWRLGSPCEVRIQVWEYWRDPESKRIGMNREFPPWNPE